MPDECHESDQLLMKAEKWTQRKQGRSRLEDAKAAIFHLRYNKKLSYTAIKHFLEEAGIKASTASLSRFFRSRFSAEAAEKTKPIVLERLATLKSAEGANQGKPTT